jgi:hypothetical protein
MNKLNFLEYLTEYHHDYSQSNDYQPLKHGDTMTVFHGFYRVDDAVKMAKQGMSGRVKADRVYSYELRNNPYGLFVTPEFKVAKNFTGGKIHVIMEFVAAYEELEAPVWPDGRYAVQGEYAKTFSGRHERFKTKKAAQYDIESDKTMPDWVKLSDDKHLAALLMTGGESQALFVGHLNPQDIKYFYVSDGSYGAEYSKLSPSEFLEKYYEQYKPSTKREKIFNPNDDFDSDKLISGLAAELRKTSEDTYETIKDIYTIYSKRPDAYSTISHDFEHYLWPKQMNQFFKWMRKEFR